MARYHAYRLIIVAAATVWPTAARAEPPSSVWELRDAVRQRERDVERAEVALAYARARLAQAEGKREVAAREWRKVVAYDEAERRRLDPFYQKLCEPWTRRRSWSTRRPSANGG
jgi:Mg-chelatase subunit ChlI